MKICILGAGSLGSAMGAYLARHADVWLINRSPDYVAAVQASGLKVTDSAGQHHVSVNSARDCSGVGVTDLLIVLVKSFDTRQAIGSAVNVIGPQTSVLSLQNGMGHELLLAEVAGREKILLGKSYVGGMMLAPGHVQATIENRHTIIGEPQGGVTDRVNRIAAVFNQSGLDTQVSSSISDVIWDKLLINVATGALSAITRLPYGKLYDVEVVRHAAIAAINEGIAVAQASGASLSTTNAEEIWFSTSRGLPADFQASMLQSIERGSITEVDFFHGVVVDKGRELNIPTPVNETLLACVKGIERGQKP